MSRGYELLVAEVDRVVTSPYPTQLKQLHNIACQNCLDTDVLEWAASRPCQVDALAGCLVQALQQWPYVLEIITKVCVARVVRDALLQHEPTLLFKMVARAVDGDWQHSTASIAMLSHPLPRHITLPAATQNLFLGIVDHAAQQPSTSSIKPVYQLLKGGLGPLLGLLSHETLTQLERHFVQILRETICKEDQCLTLYCLAIMKAIVTAANEDPSFSLAGSYETQDLLASTPNSPKWKPKGMQQYFTGGKANKTLHLIVLRVLWACRATAEDTVEQTIELLSLANELVAFMPESTREAWCVENPIIVRKLQDKACLVELEARVQLPAFAFICALCRARDVPEGMVDKLAGILCKPASFSYAMLACGPEPAVAWFAGVLNGVQLADILISITSFAVRGEYAEVIKLAETVVPVVEILKHSLKTHESVADGALAALSSASVARDLTELRQLVQNGSASESLEGGACSNAVMSERKTIGRAICGLFLSAALAADHSQTDVASELYPLLVETYALTVNSSSSCSHVAAQSRLKESVNNQQTPAAITHFPAGANWRRALDSHLQSRVQQDHNALSAFFANACADLERRCSEVEAPLREEQEKRSELQQQYDNLYRAYTTLEDSKSRVSMRADALEAEKGECVHDLEQTREANEKLLARVEELEGLLRENQRQALEQLEEMKRDFSLAEMDHATTLAKSEEHLEEVETELANARAEGREKQSANEQLESELESARSNRKTLEEELRDWRAADEEHKQIIHAAEKAREELAGRCESLLADLEEMRQSHASEEQAHAEELDRREREVEERAGMLKRQHDDAFEQMQQDHEAELARVSSVLVTAQEESRQFQAELAHVSTALSSARNESRRNQTSSDAQIEKRDKKLSEYHKKIEQLRALCSEKDDQIAEANAMRSNLMAAMGLGKMNQGSQSAKRRSTRSAVNQSELFDDTESSVPFIDILGAAAKTQHTVTQDSQLAPSPKRARSRKSGASMAPPPTQPRVSTAGRATRSSTQGRSAVRRQPLAAIDGNQSPSKDASKTPCPGGLKGFVGCGDDTTFDGSEVFASTPGLKARDAEALPEDETELV